MGQDIDRAIQRTRQYWYDDGLTEIAAGCIFVTIGLLFLAEAFRAIPSGASSIGLVAVVVGGVWVARRAIGLAKRRLTYPRTGYIRYRRERRRSRVVASAVAFSMAVLVALLFVTAPVSLAWIPAMDGLLIAAFMLYVAYSLGLVRFYALAVASAVVGVGASLSGAGDILGSGVYFGLTGVVMLASGITALVGYLCESGRSGDE